jgi:hypothetical protein
MSKGCEEDFEKHFLIMILVSDNNWLRCNNLNGLIVDFFLVMFTGGDIEHIRLNTSPLRIGVSPYIWIFYSFL